MKFTINTDPVVPAIKSVASGLRFVVHVDKNQMRSNYQAEIALKAAYREQLDKLKAEFAKK